MKELEEKTYQYTVKGISLIKSLEKEFPELLSSELKQNIGKVSIKFMDALDANETDDFAKFLRESYSSALKSLDLLKSMDEITSQNLNEEKKILIEETKSIVDQLDSIIQKLIY
jgi:adenylosuccinate synthase